MLNFVANPKVRPLEPTMHEVEARAERAAQRTGVEATEVERLPFDLSALEQEGAFINVDARGFGLLDRRIDWQALGITLPRGASVTFRPPRCGLLPDRYRLPLLRQAQRAHAALHKYSYHFTLTETLFETPAYRWVPWGAFEAFEKEFHAAELALEGAKAEVLEQYEAMLEEVVGTFLQLAADSARRLEATGHAIPEGFQEAVVARRPGDDALGGKPARQANAALPSGSDSAGQRDAGRAAQGGRAASSGGTGRGGLASGAGSARTARAPPWFRRSCGSREERVRRRLDAEEEDRRRETEIKERLRRMKLEAARERLQEAMSPLEEGAKQLHAAIYESASAIRESLRKHHYLPGGSARRVRQLARWFRLMNWQSDKQLEALLGEMESLANRPHGGKKADPGPIDQVLGDIIDLCYADARALSEPHRMAALEL